MNLEMNGSNIGAIFIMTQLNCQSWLFFHFFYLGFPQYTYYFYLFFLIVYSSFIGISSWQRGPRVAIWVGTCIGNQAKVKSVKGAVVVGRGRCRGTEGGTGSGVYVFWALVVLFVLLVAVLHGDALHASFPHRSRGLLQGQPVAHRVVHLAVEGGVEDPLQPEVPVLFLHGRARIAGDVVLHTYDGSVGVFPPPPLWSWWGSSAGRRGAADPCVQWARSPAGSWWQCTIAETHKHDTLQQNTHSGSYAASTTTTPAIMMIKRVRTVFPSTHLLTCDWG